MAASEIEFTQYALTVTLKKRCNDYLPHEQVEFIFKDLHEKDNYLSYDMRYELTKAGNIHAHGICMLKRNVFSTSRYNSKYYSQDVQIKCLFKRCHSIGFVCVKELTDKQGWSEYCTKETKEFMKKCPYVNYCVSNNVQLINPIAVEVSRMYENIDISSHDVLNDLTGSNAEALRVKSDLLVKSPVIEPVKRKRKVIKFKGKINYKICNS